MDQANEPLARRLRAAALDRTTTEAERVDDFVLDEDGVLDLRDFERDPLGHSVADPAKALATIRGQLGDAHEVSDLYDESEPERPRWRLGLRARHAYGAEIPSAVPKAAPVIREPVSKVLPPLSRLSMVPLTAEREEIHPPTPAEMTPAPVGPPVEPEIDARGEARPTANCPKCMGLGRRDLFDRFSQVEFYSCDNCMHMWQQDVS